MAGEGVNLLVGSESHASTQDVQDLERELVDPADPADKSGTGGAEGGDKGGEKGGTGGAEGGGEGGGHEEHEEEEDGERVGRIDTELAEANTDEERAAIRERRKKERKDKKDRARERNQNLERQVAQLARQNQELTRDVALLTQSASGVQMAKLDEAIAEVDNAVLFFQDEIAAATTKGDGAAVAKATSNLITARDRARELAMYKESATKQRPGQNQRQLDPGMVKNARAFMGKHTWYKGPGANDLDSRILSQVDNQVHADGFDPTGPEYWQELETRAKRYLPHRFTGGASSSTGDDDPAGASGGGKPGYNGRASGARRQPVPGGGGDAISPRGDEGYTLSAERVKAIKDAGKWDDPAERKKMISKYKQYDKEHPQR